ncbi:hypothetical protein M885DRAFT_512454 [Pelagophyceae sp. CCMP2097]|nr:hypothetical protein M885DRAFT_512454 [Pelagophyceae sp. CCMP2097]|mmetsp:Transcript_14156/g.47241  ORF Transcript_14156/g.47241 Transcript_14156/m.47241 type:complete len:286 (-) Transcript_14156:66-923(-)
MAAFSMLALLLCAVSRCGAWTARPAARRGVALNAGRWAPPKEVGSGDGAFDELMGSMTAVERGQLVVSPRSVLLALPRACGIQWATDLEFVGVRVASLDGGGAAERSGLVGVGDQLVAVDGVGVFDLDFDAAISALTTAPESKMEFFRGSRDELLGELGVALPSSADATISVFEDGVLKVKISAKKGSNLRDAIVAEGIDVYQGTTKWTNCNGKQMCGTCIVDVKKGAAGTNRRSNDEQSTLVLQKTPDSCRLACVTYVYDDVDVHVRPERGGGFFGSANSGSAW